MRCPRFCQKGSIRAAGKGQREKHAGRHERALRKRSCPSVLPLIPGVMCPHPQGQQEISLKKPPAAPKNNNGGLRRLCLLVSRPLGMVFSCLPPPPPEMYVFIFNEKHDPGAILGLTNKGRRWG